MNYEGDGVPTDKEKAAYWIKKSYENDHNKEAKELWEK
ncbi:MAG: SEL1-like repeat protein [Candidatus Cloacimonetes bacterium]|nr:SEL1-like repeat protein [Candidatus Cloacimonadota bacterium]MBS3767688.1 SEL1-like repeat protein [Candidatus Cloacimonadota bacterium]